MLQQEKLNYLEQIAHGFAEHFGRNCEIVIHKIDHDNLNHSIVAIEHGHVSSRQVGDGASKVVLEALKKDPKTLKDRYNYQTKTADGRILKSSTIYIKNELEKLEAIFSINYDVSSLIAAESTISNLIITSDAPEQKEANLIPNNVNDLLDDLIEESVKLVGKPVALMNKDDKVAAIQFLNEKGAFLIQKSGDKVSNYFNISKYTLYNYIG